MLAPQVHADANTALLDLSLRARDRHLHLAEELEAETGLSVELCSVGALEVALTEEEERSLSARVAWQRGHRLPVETLTAEEILQAEPTLNPAVRAGALIAGDRRVDNVRLVRALAASAVTRGVSLLCGRPVTALLIETGRVAGVRTGAETLRAPLVVNAAGAWAGRPRGAPPPPPPLAGPRRTRALGAAPAPVCPRRWAPPGHPPPPARRPPPA